MKTKPKPKEEQELLSQIESLKSQLARALADYDNLSKRTAREREEFSKIANLRLVIRLLSVLDMLDSAQEHLNDPGLAICTKEFRDVLTDEGLSEIRPKEGEVFNEDLHEAIDVVETDGSNEDNTIAEVSLPGWKVGEDQIVRHAKVKVYKKNN